MLDTDSALSGDLLQTMKRESGVKLGTEKGKKQKGENVSNKNLENFKEGEST